MPVPRKRFPLSLIALLLAAWALLLINLGVPWFGHQDGNGAWISAAVRNYQRYGHLNGMVVLNTAVTTSEHFDYYPHHPPLVVWLSALPVLLTEYDEALLRFVAASATLLGIAAFYALNRRLFGQTRALWSAALYAFTPMVAYFGRMPDHEAVALPVIFLFAALLVDWLRRPTRIRWIGLALLAWLAAWTAWAAVIFVGVLGLVAFLHGGRGVRPGVIGLGLVTLAAVIVMLGYYQLNDPTALASIRDAFLWRSSSDALERGSQTFTLGEYFARLLTRLITLITPTILALAVIGLAMLHRTPPFERSIVLALLTAGAAYLLVFRNASYIHDYYAIYLTPALAMLASGMVTLRLRSRASRLLRPLVVALVLTTPLPLWTYLSALHHTADQPEPPRIAAALAARTEADALIFSDLPSLGLATEFYASRAIQWETDLAALPATFPAQQPAYFLHCAPDPLDRGRGISERISPNCWLTPLG